MRLLCRDEMTAGGGERVSPPMPGGDEQQAGSKNRVGWEKERYLAVGETERPRESRRQIVTCGDGQNPEYREEKEPCSFLPPGVSVEFRFGIHFSCRGENVHTNK